MFVRIRATLYKVKEQTDVVKDSVMAYTYLAMEQKGLWEKTLGNEKNAACPSKSIYFLRGRQRERESESESESERGGE